MVGGPGPFDSRQHGVDENDFADAGHLHSGDRLLHEGSDELVRNVWPRTGSDFEAQVTAGGWVVEFASGEQWIFWEDGDFELLTTDAAAIAPRVQTGRLQGGVTPSPITNLAGSGLQVNNNELEATASGGGEWDTGIQFLAVSGQSSGTFSGWSPSYDQYRVVCQSDDSASSVAIHLRVNGVSSGYDTRLTDGSQTSEGFVRQVFHSQYAAGGEVKLTSNFDRNFSGSSEGGAGVQQAADEFENDSVSSPVSSIELFNDAANNFTANFRLDGRDIT